MGVLESVILQPQEFLFDHGLSQQGFCGEMIVDGRVTDLQNDSDIRIEKALNPLCGSVNPPGG